MDFRALKADEIDCRIQSVKEGKGLILLLYKDARVDMTILDETVGVENWQREFYESMGRLFCRTGIRIVPQDGEPYWVWKSDCGSETQAEPEKGLASDASKRSCFAFGIGRELYTAPLIWIPASKCNLQGSKCYDRFSVEKIVIENKTIMAISIINESIKADKISDKRCFVWQRNKP